METNGSSNFKAWFNNADMPTQAEDGAWYDAETGAPFVAIKKARVAKHPLSKLKATELRAKLSRLLVSSRITLERASCPLPLTAAFIAAAELVVARTKKVELIALIDQCSDADRAANALR